MAHNNWSTHDINTKFFKNLSLSPPPHTLVDVSMATAREKPYDSSPIIQSKHDELINILTQEIISICNACKGFVQMNLFPLKLANLPWFEKRGQDVCTSILWVLLSLFIKWSWFRPNRIVWTGPLLLKEWSTEQLERANTVKLILQLKNDHHDGSMGMLCIK